MSCKFAGSICNVCETPHMPRLFLSDAHVPSVILLNRCRCDTAHEAQSVNHCLVTHCVIVSREATRPMDHFRPFPVLIKRAIVICCRTSLMASRYRCHCLMPFSKVITRLLAFAIGFDNRTRVMLAFQHFCWPLAWNARLGTLIILI